MARMEKFLDSREFARMTRAIEFIEREYQRQPKLAEIARHVGLSDFHFNRLFRRWTGLTPKQYLAEVTSRAAGAALHDEPSVMEAAHSVGLSGGSRLHDLTVTLEAMSPGEIRAGGEGVEIRHGITVTLLRLSFLDGRSDASEMAALRVSWPRARFVRDDVRAAELAASIWASRPGSGGHKTVTLPLAVSGTNFQVQVWRALLELDPRATVTYSALARQLGKPDGARAVGNAVGANPIAWVIPCHRVLKASGELGGYRWGAARKQMIRRWEERRAGMS
jgi:AraC family transcriptional regulator, regulatory protein of adaptative response / methylated-DNA-[protein]-cysteine methyltransferase